MQFHLQVPVLVLAGLVLAATALAQDPSIEAGFRDDLTVMGRDGTRQEPDVEVYGYSAFGTNLSGAAYVTSGVGQVYIQRSLEVGSNLYARGNVTFADGTTQATAYNTNTLYTLASGECDTNRVDILLSTSYLVSGIRVFQNAVTSQTIGVYLNGASVTSFPFTTAATSQTLAIQLSAADRLGVACTNINGTVLFSFEGRRR